MACVITSLYTVGVNTCELLVNFVGRQKTNTQPRTKGLDVSWSSSAFGGKVGVGSVDGGSWRGTSGRWGKQVIR